MLTLVGAGFVRDGADIERVRQDLVEMPSAEGLAAGPSACAVDPCRHDNPLPVEERFENRNLPKVQIGIEYALHDGRMLLDGMEGPIGHAVSEGDAAHPHALLLRGRDLVADALARDLALQL